MLTGLAIRDVVLIERLDLTLGRGLNALTGETGAGKSILLDALGLALGHRSEAGLIRKGAAQATVTATFEPPADHAVQALLVEQGIAPEDTLILKRIVMPDGRSRAFINDQSCSLALMKTIAGTLVETHGQFDTGTLLDAATHRATLDGFGRLHKPLAAVQEAWRLLQASRTALTEARTTQENARREKSFLRESLVQLDDLDPKRGEETELEEKRSRLANRDRIMDALGTAITELSGPRGAETALNNARRALDRITAHGSAALTEAVTALQSAAVEIQEAGSVLSALREGDGDSETTLEKVDDRLFALRNAARRFGVELGGLAALRDDFRARLAVVDDGGASLAKLARDEADAKTAYEKSAAVLTAARARAAKNFDKAIGAELPPLKLDKARIETRLEALAEPEWAAAGVERVSFLVTTNPGAEPGPLGKIASGGELSRFMLALKVVLAGVADIPVLVFDEVDSGIGGATADAVGERLKKLGGEVQVLVVTHSPQVAARADQQWRVEKITKGQSVTTDIVPLDAVGRLEEIARMLSGAVITDEARAAAKRLLTAV